MPAPGIRGLALETSGLTGSVALALDGQVVASDTFSYGLSNAARLLPILDTLCKSQAWQPPDIREIYVSIGPGSFTGLRIGVILAKTLAFATAATIAAVPTALVLAYNAPPEANDLIVLLDAKRRDIFTARLHRQANQWHPTEPAHLDTLPAMLARAPRPVYLIGQGLAVHRDQVPNEKDVHALPEQTWTAHASVVAQLGHQMLRAGQSTAPALLVPLYIRRPEAEEKADTASLAARIHLK